MANNGIGTQIRVLRTHRGLSQQELAAAIGVTHPVISYIETGKATPTAEQLARIKAALNWPSDEAMAEAFALLAGEPAGCRVDDAAEEE